MNTDPFRVRALTKKELAYLYFPDAVDPKAAVGRLMRMIRGCPGLEAQMTAAGYAKMQKILSPRVVGVIVGWLGEP